MARASPRYLPEGALVEVTVRVMHGLFWLRPSPRVTDIIRGVFARAQERFGIEIHAYTVMSNHLPQEGAWQFLSAWPSPHAMEWRDR